MKKQALMGIDITTDCDLDELTDFVRKKLESKDDRATIISFINPHAYWLIEKVPEYKECLPSFDAILCDGIGVVYAARMLGLKEVHRLSFDSTSIAPAIFDLCKEHHYSLFLVGGKPGVADSAGAIIAKEWEVNIAGCAHGYLKDYAQTYETIISSNIAVVVCGMGAPYQEKFLLGLKSAGWCGVGFTCGGYLDQIQVAGRQYYPAWIDRYNLRFFYRFYKEPARLWRRYFLEYGVFFRRLLRSILLEGWRM